ncbi:MAG: M23 family metallopeptidase, partial [Caulobacteraceae bacterium]
MDRVARHGLTRRGAVAGLAGLTLAADGTAAEDFRYGGKLQQAGFLVGRSAPRAEVLIDGEKVGVASLGGVFLVGFDRDEPETAKVGVRQGKVETDHALAIARGDFDVQRIDGLPEDQVSPANPALLARIAKETEHKAKALASLDDADSFKDGFDWPVIAKRISARFGGQRILNGEPKRPHYGVDLAAPVGSPIHAPAPGLVVLAEPAMHFEGGLTLIDHGQGLVGMFLHQSRQMVKAGDRVVRGQL